MRAGVGEREWENGSEDADEDADEDEREKKLREA